MSSHRSPAVARLRRARWLMTGMVTVITATVIAVLGYVAASLDNESRTRAVDSRIEMVAGGLARAIQEDGNGALDLSTIIDDDLATGSTAVVIVMRKPGEQWKQAHTYERSLMPSDNDIATLATQAEDHSDNLIYTPSLRDSTAITGRAVRVAAVPVYWNDWDNIVMILAAEEPVDDPGAHLKLLWALGLGGLLFVALASAAAYLIAGSSLGQALRMLDEHEQFLGDAAHELRTPLTTLKLLTESHPKPDEVEHTLAEARRLADRMARLVTGLLARARLQTGIAEPERTLLRLDQLAEAVAEESGDPRIVVTAHPSVVVGDPSLLSLAIRNMLENGLTHGAVNRTAPVEVHIAEGRVSVRDHGPGVDPVMSASPFNRGAAGRTGRNGIGLALVAWVAQAHGGNASIEPAVGGGTIATLWLPPADITANTPARV
ncbi:sensor histidine kinase [Nocardia huaxiensis]|uniref:histidine kinase n=1 Tax=Nocardia huaxiensis TaxID=2755382 RepID=A0A7D6ZW58_9NOCA|nr:HAMP domain-containing sensor histidine kinase [Nocardia huaxiensis]QLY30109.1 HAMP domain-containing histidine kinase [Nocardia huaxiensis]UFS96281.1 HAMP domain-containing histidine kinase [Nocardia huaxiensis]